MPETIVKRHVFVAKDPREDFPRECVECATRADHEWHLQAVELSDTGQAWAAELAAVNASIKAVEQLLVPLEERRTAAVRNLQAEIGDAEAATIDGKLVVLWTWSKPGDAIDLAALKRDHPAIYEAYYKPKKAARPFKPVAA